MSHHYVPVNRSLTPNEQAVLAKLLTEDFPGAHELREQVNFLRVRSECVACPEIEFDVGPDAIPALVTSRVPVEAAEHGEWYPGRVHVLLYVVDGRLNSFEVFREDGSSVTDLPDASTLSVEVNAAAS